MSIFFRSAVPDDLEILEIIERECFRDPWNAEMLFSELNMPRATYELLTDGESVFGYLSYLHILDELHIMNIAVLPDYQGMGYGKFMVKKIINDAKTKKATAITLEVRESNYRAQRMYEGLGFFCAGTRPNYYMDKENALIYWLSLEE